MQRRFVGRTATGEDSENRRDQGGRPGGEARGSFEELSLKAPGMIMMTTRKDGVSNGPRRRQGRPGWRGEQLGRLRQ